MSILVAVKAQFKTNHALLTPATFFCYCLILVLHDRIGYAGEVLHSTAGKWDPVQRRLTITNYAPRIWGFESTSSVKEGCWYPFTGASHANFFVTFEATLDVFMNEVMERHF